MVPYDIVIIPCPKCLVSHTVHVTTGQCLMTSYPLSLAPEDVLGGINTFAPFSCESCRTKFYVKKFEDGQIRAVEWTENLWKEKSP